MAIIHAGSLAPAGPLRVFEEGDFRTLGIKQLHNRRAFIPLGTERRGEGSPVRSFAFPSSY